MMQAHSDKSDYERYLIFAFMELHEETELVEYIHSAELGPVMRQFLTDRVTGNKKRPPRKKASTLWRDFNIYTDIQLLLAAKTEGGAMASLTEAEWGLIQKTYRVDRGVVIKAYTRINKIAKSDGLSWVEFWKKAIDKSQ